MKTVHNAAAILGLFLLVLLTADIIAGWVKSNKAATTPSPQPIQPILMR